MQMIDILSRHSFMIPHLGYIYLLGQVRPVEELTSGMIMILSIVPFIVLLAILKYRAAYHRKILKWQKFESGIGTGSSFSVYWREILLWEAKTAPVYSPILNGSWDLLCGLVVWLLFPPRLTLAYILIPCIYNFFQLTMKKSKCNSIIGADSCVYNCRQYIFIRGGLYYCKLEDGDQSIMYYPTADLHTLTPVDN
jgi:hypothetical protein